MGSSGGALRARLAVLALACGVARGGEYGGGGGLPLYGDPAPAQYGAALDYRAPDASAPLDYKYVEDSQGTERPIRDTVDLDPWKKRSRNRGQRGDDRSNGGVDVDAVPTFKPRRARGRARPRARPVALEERRRHRQRRQRSRHDDFSPEDHSDKGDYHVNVNKHLDEDLYPFNLRKTTERIIRRKPRDRLFSDHVKPLKSHDLESEEELISDRKMKSESVVREEADLEEQNDRQPAPAPSPRPHGGGGGPGDDEGEEGEERLEPAVYRDDTDYYDMRRLHDIDAKLPLLLRRTTTRPPAGRGETSAGTSTAADLLALLLTARRGAGALPHSTRAPPDDHTRLHEDPRLSSARPEPDPTTLHLAISRTIPESFFVDSTSELSIAEKSRLSILKKSQKKDSDKGSPSKKPPVLLQVTSRLPTVVMVEPPTSADPWMRARHVSGDSPQKLEKVKNLMRRKLVAGAKNIQDLTDNWDDMVCDYIDMSLLDAAPRPLRCAPALPLLAAALALFM